MSGNMDGEGEGSLDRLLFHRIQALEEQGLIDDKFRLCHSLKEDSGVFFFVNLVPVFLSDALAVVRKMITILDHVIVDFDGLSECCFKLEGSAACIGACRMKDACSGLRRAIDDRSKDACLLALDSIKKEYHILQTQLEYIVQLEQEIVSKGSQKP